MPVPKPTETIPVEDEDQVPPGIASLMPNIEPTQTVVAPVIGAGPGITVSTLVTVQPIPIVYEITTVPAAIPVMLPVDEPIVAINELPLVHIPPATDSLKATEDPTQTLEAPVIPVGMGSTVIVEVT
jgi:hypothetical protein